MPIQAALVLMALALPIQATKQTPPKAVADVWGLYEVEEDPDRLYKNWDLQGFGQELIYIRANYYKLDHKEFWDSAKTRKRQEYHITIRMDPLPARLKPGQVMELGVEGTCQRDVMTSFVHRWGEYRSGEVKAELLRSGAAGAQRPHKTGMRAFVGYHEIFGFRSRWAGTYRLTVPAKPPEFISVTQFCEGRMAVFKYRKGATPIEPP